MFVYQKSTNFINHFLSICNHLLVLLNDKIGFVDQVFVEHPEEHPVEHPV